MSSRQSVFVKFKNHLKMPREIVILKMQKEKKIVFYCLEKDVLVKNELTYLNFLSRKHGLFWMKYHRFELSKIISVKKFIPPYMFLPLKSIELYVFFQKESSKKMYVVVHPLNIFAYFENFIDQTKANNFYPYPIAASLHYTASINIVKIVDDTVKIILM